MCLVLGQDPDRALPNWDRIVATCVIVPETFDNDVSYGTNKVLTATHKINKVERPDKLKVRIIEFDRDGVKPEEGESHRDFVVGRIGHYKADGKIRRAGKYRRSKTVQILH